MICTTCGQQNELGVPFCAACGTPLPITHVDVVEPEPVDLLPAEPEPVEPEPVDPEPAEPQRPEWAPPTRALVTPAPVQMPPTAPQPAANAFPPAAFAHGTHQPSYLPYGVPHTPQFPVGPLIGAAGATIAFVALLLPVFVALGQPYGRSDPAVQSSAVPAFPGTALLMAAIAVAWFAAVAAAVIRVRFMVAASAIVGVIAAILCAVDAIFALTHLGGWSPAAGPTLELVGTALILIGAGVTAAQIRPRIMAYQVSPLRSRA